MKKRILVIGPGGSGKSCICSFINGESKKIRKTSDVIFGKYTVDVPGSYLDNPSMLQHLIALAQNYAAVIVMLVDASNPNEKYSPGFARLFNTQAVGVITKYSPENKLRCERQLEKMGIEKPWFYIAENGKGMEDLKKYLIRAAFDGG